MSEPIPEAIPTSADPRSHRPLKRARGAYTSNPNVRATSQQAHELESLFLDPSRPVQLPPASSAVKKSLPAPPEIVANVQGSSAGAGSGEFHVYKASRRREYERLRAMDEEAKKEEENEKWEREERERREKDEEKTRRNRERRNKRKGKKDKEKQTDGGVNGAKDAVENGEAQGIKRKAGGLQIPPKGSQEEEQGSDFGVAEVVKETGITIHDDD
ncbi:uncharacterized protein Z520_07829 [Fonsecaea multimorphosa CBS 102226]|uniref:PRKR-interacting protein 1 n=1 Tax=Fonsecaea multimorphosa CBS 102226 TaxID=1442371 RepID=A0A0D2KIV9_9EURO|nr:uncharacterized protein Z520_07829 [Fonsecaea multimorphosa CBS 102226]KIX96563.1 hypothetical protein Z520_07829 [Fonsecaea multimorphosa CBS 102226]OAL22076.1 hypothetical protein AYO22_07436 [Fonsecaea multimorphosa]